MNNRERIVATAFCKKTDRAPMILYLCAWDETMYKWETEEEYPQGADLAVETGYDPGIKAVDEIKLGLFPEFETEVIEEREHTTIIRNSFGVMEECMKDKSTIPRGISYPVTCMEDWEQIKHERLNPNSPERFPANWSEICNQYNHGEHAVQIGDFPYGLFGTVRELMGVEGTLLAFYDQPELIEDMMNYLTDFWLTLYERAACELNIDCVHIWEDMSGKQGSLISPNMIQEFMIPNYQKIKSFAKKQNAFVMLDTDGNCDMLIPLFIEGGIDLLMPFEVAAGSDVIKYRAKYPNLSMLGGIDKRELAKGRDAIDCELARIEPLLSENGFFPALDHLIHPEVSYANFKYYTERLRELINKHAR